MWILKNSKELLENLKAQSLHSVNSIKSFDFSTLYTTIPHDKLKSKLKKIINRSFFHKNGNRRFQYVVLATKTYTSLWRATKILRCRCHKDAGISNRQYFCRVQPTDILANNQHTDGYLLCTVTCRLVFILVWGGVCTKSPPCMQETLRTTIQFHQ